MKRYEHRVFRETHQALDPDDSVDDFCVDRMNILGEEGWAIIKMETEYSSYEVKTSNGESCLFVRLHIYMVGRREKQQCS